VYYGNGGPGIPVRPEQRRPDDSAPIAHLGLADDGDVRLSALGRAPIGRAWVALETEVKPLSVPFDGSKTDITAYSDSTVAGVELVRLEQRLGVSAQYRWRARLRYEIATSPFEQWSRWFSPFGNGAEEADFRNDVICPNNIPAQLHSYGVGKAGTPGMPVLPSASAPVLGTQSDLTITNGNPGDLSVLFVGLAPVNVPFDGGSLLVAQNVVVGLLPFNGAGVSAVPVNVPNQPNLCGASIYTQAIWVDTGGGATGFSMTAQTQGLQWIFGG